MVQIGHFWLKIADLSAKHANPWGLTVLHEAKKGLCFNFKSHIPKG
jgi:hypothetical protein